MQRLFLVDTEILLDYLRGHPIAVRFAIEHADRITVFAMSVAELYAGVRGPAEDAELQDLENFRALFPVVPVSADIARVGGLYRQAYGRSHGVGLAEAVIAATGDLSESALKTLKVKHYPMFSGLDPADRK